jgi:formate hydrogenlyase regulatory protein HycA
MVSVMAVPDVIPIAHEPGYRTDTIGRYDGGQFFASVTYAFRTSYTRQDGPWQDHKRLFVVLHTFETDGSHRDSDIWCAGTQREVMQAGSRAHGDDPGAQADARLAKLLDALPGREYTDIAIRPFRVVFDDAIFGLVVERHAEDGTEDDWAELYPDALGFQEPWDGQYDT